MKHSQSQTCPDHFRMNAHCQSDYQLLFEHLEEDPNLPPVDPYEKIGKDVDIADLQHRLEILKNLIKEKNQLKEKAAANVWYMAQLRMLEQEIGLLTKASDKLGTIDTKDGKVNFFDFQWGFEKIKVRKANKYIEKAWQIEAQLVALEKSLGIERPMTHRQMMATMKKMQWAVGDGDLNGSVSSVVNAVNGGTLDANTLQQLQQWATTSNGLMSNLSGSVKEYQNKGANRISEHTNATPQQAKTITKLATAGVLIAWFLYFWNDVKGWKNKALVAWWLYAILAMAFGNKKASDVIDGVLAGNGMLSRGTLTAPNTGQYGLETSTYNKMYEWKKTVEWLLSYMKDQNDNSAFLKEYITMENGKRAFDAQKLVDTFENESTNEQVTKYLKEWNENTAKFMMILAAYKGRLAKQEHAKMNDEVNTYLQTIGVKSDSDLTAKNIREKDLEAYNAGQTKYEEEMKKNTETLNQQLPKWYRIKAGQELAALAIYEAYKEQWWNLSETSKQEKLKGLIELIPSTSADIEEYKQSLITANVFNANRSPEQIDEFVKTRYEVKSEMTQFGGNPTLTVDNSQLRLNAFSTTLKINMSNPYGMFIDAPMIEKYNTSDSRISANPKKILHLAHATCGIISTLHQTGYKSTTDNPFVVGDAFGIIDMKDNSGWLVNRFKWVIGMQDWQRMIGLAGLDNNERKPYADFLNGMGYEVIEKVDKVTVEKIPVLDANNKPTGKFDEVKKKEKVDGKIIKSIWKVGNKLPAQYSRTDGIKDNSYDTPEVIKPTKENLQTSWEKIQNFIVEWFDRTFKTLEDSWKLVIKSWGSLIEATWSSAADPLIMSITNTAWQVITQTIDWPIQKAIMTFASMAEPVIQKIFWALNANKTLINDALWWLPAKIISGTSTIIDWISWITTALKDWAPDIITSLTNILKDAWVAIQNMTADWEVWIQELAIVWVLMWLFKK